MRVILALVVAFNITACVSGHQEFYTPYVDARTLENVELLTPDQEPKVYGTNDLDRDRKILMSKMYRPVGYSSFNGEYEDDNDVKAQAKRVGATVVLNTPTLKLRHHHYSCLAHLQRSILVPCTAVVYMGDTAELVQHMEGPQFR